MLRMNPFLGFLSLLLLLLHTQTLHAALPGGEEMWYRPGAPSAAERSVRLYVFWSSRCPHCTAALPFVEDLALHYSWLKPESYEIYEHAENRPRFKAMAELLGSDANSVPTFMWCGQQSVGFSEPASSGRMLEKALRDCYAQAYGEAPPEPWLVAAADGAPTKMFTPLPAGLDPERLSLPVLTLVMAGLDAFNPCVFFVLLMLLSLLVHARNRRLMLLVGGVFVFFSGLIYFLFMAAWLNAFRWLGEIQLITVAAGLVTVAIGLVNIKDFFWFKRGASLSLSDASRQSLLARMRRLLRGDNPPALIAGTVVLAIAANSYELLCTVGFPMVYTRILTLHRFPETQYYLYLALYNLIYVLPLLLIVLAFVATLGARKLTESEGRTLKLMSGLMMLGLGLLLLFAPHALGNALTAVMLLLAAIALSVLMNRLDRYRTRQAD